MVTTPHDDDIRRVGSHSLTERPRWSTVCRMRRSLSAAVAAPLLVLACAGRPAPPTPKPPGPADGLSAPPPQANGRLPDLATPTHYALDLTVDPTKPRFTGVVRIDIDIPKTTSFIVLHGSKIDVRSAHVEIAREPALRALTSARGTAGGNVPEELALTFPKPLPPGHARLVIDYTAPFDDELSGLYRVRDGERWYAFTQFEATDARRAFPCFDEPSFKVPFDVSITVPHPMIAVANAPEASHEEVGDGTRFRFNPTQPLPTYLVAFAVGEFEIKDATRFTRPPVRIITTKGKSAMTSLALEATGGIVDALSDWFAIPYPYDKLDIVAVPELAPGAMENPGLLTFREERLLLDPTRASVAARRGQALIIAHELAHQWFGDLVTASWWNDIWLNEGMARWMEARAVDLWRPALGARLDSISSAHGVMDLDGLVSARAVRQPVVTTNDAQEAFDAITYEKGAAVLSTIERWIGEETFQRGVRDYLRDNAWKSVQADRLLDALDKASGKDVTQMASSYLDKPGVPEVAARLECEPGGRWHAELSSGQWRPLGSAEVDGALGTWTIPVCVRPQGEKKDTCVELVAGAPSLVTGKGRCPTFVHPNSNAAYYRFAVNERDFTRLAEGRKELDLPARISLLSNAWAAVRSGAIEPKALLTILPAFDDDNARQIVDQVVAILYGMSDILVDDDGRAPFRKFALERLAKRKKALGWSPPPKGDVSSDDALSRRSVMLAMGDLVEDDTTLREAEELATKWLAEPSSVDADTASVALDLASRKALEGRVTALLEATKNAKSRENRLIALRAMMGFDTEERLVQALDLTLGADVRSNEMRYVMSAVLARRKSRPIAEAWVRAHWDDLRKKLPGALSSTLLRAAGVGCSSAEATERAAFYTPRVDAIEGARRGLAESLEAVSLCAALRASGTPSLRKALLTLRR